MTANPKVQWSDEAFGFLANIYDQKSTQKIKDHIDKHMMDIPSTTKHVYANHIFSSKPPIHHIYPPFNTRQCAIYDKHFGTVTSITCSPF